MNQDIYISYSIRDYETARIITNILDSGGYTYFIDIESIAVGQEFAEVITQAINSCKVFVFLFSENSYKSNFAQNELIYALNKKKEIVLIGIDFSPLPPELELEPFNKALLRITQPNFKKNFLKLIGESLGNKVDRILSEKQEKANLEAAEERRNGAKDYVPQKIDVDVFISYRRVDGRDYARNIMQALKIFGYPKVFFDYNSLRDGVFNTQILDAIYSCNDFILVISPLALKNCGREGDWVTKEIRMALKYKKKIVPVVIEDTFTGWPTDFPKDLSLIKDIQFHKLMTDEYFEDSIEKLAKRLVTAVSTDKKDFIGFQDLQTSEPIHKETVFYKIKVDKKSRLMLDDEEIQVLEASKLIKVPLPKGEYIRKIVDFEDENNYKEDVLVLEGEKAELIRLSN